MRAYGIPRIKDIKGADILDIKKFGLGKGGKDYFPNKREKRRIRRVYNMLGINTVKKILSLFTQK